MAEKKLTAIFDMQDRMSQKLKAMTGNMTGAEKAAQKVGKAVDEVGRKKVNPTIDVNDKATSKIQRITGTIRSVASKSVSVAVGVTDKATQALDKIQGKLTSLPATIGMTAAGLGAGAVAKSSLDTAMQFEKTMSRVKALSQPTQAEFQTMNDLAIQLGQEMVYSSTQVAEGMVVLGAAGLDAKQMMGALPSVLNAAAASGENFNETADLMIGTMSGMQMGIKDLPHIADVMAKAALSSTISMTDFGYTMKYVAPVAATAGQKLEAVAAATAILGNANIKADTAGTSLRMGLMRLAAAPKPAQKAMDKLGFSAVQANGKFKPMSKMIEELHGKFKKLSDAEKIDTAKGLFGVEAAPAWITLIAKGPEEFRKMEQAMLKADGSAKQMADTMTDNLSGSVEQLKGAWEAMQIKGLQASMPILKELTDLMTNFTEGSIPKVEALGLAFAATLNEAFLPFKKPDPVALSVIRTDEPNPWGKGPKLPDELMKNAKSDRQKAIEEYHRQMELYNKPFDEKVTYALDVMADKTQVWLDGSGGEKMQKIFEKLATIAFEAWWGTLTKLMESSMNNLMQGNFATSGATALAAYVLGGGLVLKGGKKLWDTGKKVKNFVSPSKAAETATKATGGATKASAKATGEAVKPESRATKNFKVERKPAYERASQAAKADPYGTGRGATVQENGKKTIKAPPKPPEPTKMQKMLKTGGKVLGPAAAALSAKEGWDLGGQFGDWVFGHQTGQVKDYNLIGKNEVWQDTRDPIWKRMFSYRKDLPKPVEPGTNVGKMLQGSFAEMTGLNTATKTAATQVTSTSSAIKASGDNVDRNFQALSTAAGIGTSTLQRSMDNVKAQGDALSRSMGGLAGATDSVADKILGAVVGGVQTAASGISGALSWLSKNLFADGGIAGGLPNGGKVSKPTFVGGGTGVAGEVKGKPEMVIPLDPLKKGRAAELIHQAQKIVGFNWFANGGVTQRLSAQQMSAMRSTLSRNSKTGTVTVQVGGVSVQVSNSGSKQDIINEAVLQLANMLNDALDDDAINGALAQP